MNHELEVIRVTGLTPYWPCYLAMRAFTDGRGASDVDQAWVVEHPPVYTLGQAGRESHVVSPGAIPVARVDRGGQVTYHGPGQLVVYPLLDTRRRGDGIKNLVWGMEQAVIDWLAEIGIIAERRVGAPGVYVAGRKIAALGLRIRRQGCYHGLALNVCNDLTPFAGIHPCGYPDLAVTRVAEARPDISLEDCARGLVPWLARRLGAELGPWRESTPEALFARYPGEEG